MADDQGQLQNIYEMLWRAFPDDVHIVRPLIQMYRENQNQAMAQQVAMQMARNLLARGAASDAMGFLQICKQLDHPEKDELESLMAVALLTEESGSLPELDRTFSLIARLSDGEAMDFIRQGNLKTIASGEDIIRQGEIGQTFYLILEGTVDVSVTNNRGQNVVVTNLKAGNFFGEFACIYKLPRTATVSACAPSLLLEFTSHHIKKLAKHSTFAGERLMQIIQQRLVESMTYAHPAFAHVIVEDRRWIGQRSRVLVLRQGPVEHTEMFRTHCCIVLHGEMLSWRDSDDERYSVTFPSKHMLGDVYRYLTVPEGVYFEVENRCIICCIPRQVFSSLIIAYSDFEEWVKQHGLENLEGWHAPLPDKRK
ncbi:MAG: hypothetical protein AUJ56_02635 [Zetaproteobacteria bacterium CG1_02_49_23]|nr:MAG: hypothetical protein AUJ56_02635 [Zetaproteobacteria bacterium CG1_02_49_23]